MSSSCLQFMATLCMSILQKVLSSTTLLSSCKGSSSFPAAFHLSQHECPFQRSLPSCDMSKAGQSLLRHFFPPKIVQARFDLRFTCLSFWLCRVSASLSSSTACKTHHFPPTHKKTYCFLSAFFSWNIEQNVQCAHAHAQHLVVIRHPVTSDLWQSHEWVTCRTVSYTHLTLPTKA